MEAEFGIVANVESDKAFRRGAKVRLHRIMDSLERARCSGASRGGRTVTKIMPLKRLTNFRAAFVPENVRHKTALLMTRPEAESLARALSDRWQDVRYYHQDGRLLKDGKTTGQVFSS